MIRIFRLVGVFSSTVEVVVGAYLVDVNPEGCVDYSKGTHVRFTLGELQKSYIVQLRSWK